jgi:hypothetical protein
MSSVSLIPTGPVCEGEEAEASGGEGEGPDSPAKALLGAKKGAAQRREAVLGRGRRRPSPRRFARRVAPRA